MSNAETAYQTLQEQVGHQDRGDWFTISQEQIDAFADVTHDHQFIHSDPVRAAAETPFGGTVAHGFLTLSLLSHLTGSMGPGSQEFDGMVMALNYGLDKVRFINPVPSGSRVRASTVLSKVELKDSAVDIIEAITVEIEGEERPAMYAEWIGRLVFDS
jgi:acyl dehydratase